MNAEAMIERMEGFPAAVRAIVATVSENDCRWKPSTTQWSILEIVMHLCDEEIEDFRTRLRLTLEEPGTPWPAIDPEAAATERAYNDADVDEAMERFERERTKSIDWLRVHARNADWEVAHTHPKLGSMTAGDILAAWAAHDQLHLRQLARRCYDLVQRDASEHSSEYAGAWSHA